MSFSKHFSSVSEHYSSISEVAWCLPLVELVENIMDTCECTAERVRAPMQELAEDFVAACGEVSHSCGVAFELDRIELHTKSSRTSSEHISANVSAISAAMKQVMVQAQCQTKVALVDKKRVSLRIDVMQNDVLTYLEQQGCDFLAFRCVSRGCYGLVSHGCHGGDPTLPILKPIESFLRNEEQAYKIAMKIVSVPAAMVWFVPAVLIKMMAFDSAVAFAMTLGGDEDAWDRFLFSLRTLPEALEICGFAVFNFIRAVLATHPDYLSFEGPVKLAFNDCISAVASADELWQYWCIRPEHASLLPNSLPAPFECCFESAHPDSRLGELGFEKQVFLDMLD